MPNETDVLIVGGGPVGLMLGCELRRRDIACRLIDKYAKYPSTSRANGVQPRAMEILDNLGVADQVSEHAYRSRGVRIMRYGSEAGRFALQKDDDKDAVDQPYFSVTFANQAVVEKALRDKLTEFGGQVELQHELRSIQETPDGVVAEIVNVATGACEQVKAKYVVGCDGSHSTVRELLKLPFPGKDYPDVFAQMDAYLDGEMPEGLMTLWLSDGGLFGALPFREPGLWRLMAQVYPDADGNVPEASVELFERLLAERARDTTTKIIRTEWISNFVVHHRIVDHYRKGRAFLAGDAAHVHSPIGGQGMNTGIQDAFNLAWKLALVIQNKAPEALLDTYEAERRPVGLKVLEQTDVNHRLRVSGSPLSDILMDRIVFPLLRIPAILDVVADFVLKRGSQLDVAYRESSLSQDSGNLRKGPQPGDRGPDAHLVNAAGQSTTLFTRFRTPGFDLLLFQGKRHAADVPSLVALGERVNAATGGLVHPTTVIAEDEISGGEPSVFNDPKHHGHNAYGASGPRMYLVRPDGYIGWRGRVDGEAKLLDYLRTHYNIVK